MKRIVAVLIIAVAATCAYSQVQLEDFQAAFENFATDMAGSLAVNSTIGGNWSDAYVGSFPHLGIGLTGGVTFVGGDITSKLFQSTGGDSPAGLENTGLPIPALVGTFKIGLPVIPMDIGFKLGFIPSSVGKSIMESSGTDLSYTNFGIQARYVLVKQKKMSFIPNVSVGLAYNHLSGSVTAPSGIGAQQFDIENTPYYIGTTDPEISLDFKSNTIDLTAQVSKKFFILVPYLGTGVTFGKSTVEGGVSSQLYTNYPGGIEALKSFLESMGYDGPDITSQGFSYLAAETSPLFRIYGGLSLRIIILDVDVQALYLPSTKSLGLSLTGRVQF